MTFLNVLLDGNCIFGFIFLPPFRYMVHIDENGDAEGNYTVLGLQPSRHDFSAHGLYPVAIFTRLYQNSRNLPVYLMILLSNLNISPPPTPHLEAGGKVLKGKEGPFLIFLTWPHSSCFFYVLRTRGGAVSYDSFQLQGVA